MPVNSFFNGKNTRWHIKVAKIAEVDSCRRTIEISPKIKPSKSTVYRVYSETIPIAIFIEYMQIYWIIKIADITPVCSNRVCICKISTKFNLNNTRSYSASGIASYHQRVPFSIILYYLNTLKIIGYDTSDIAKVNSHWCIKHAISKV